MSLDNDNNKDSNSIAINLRHQKQIGKIWRDRCSRRALDCVNNFYRAQQSAPGAEPAYH